jgi:plasmid stabilization system protein ParE
VRIALLAEAEAELDNASAWYDEQRFGLAEELLRAVHDALIVIAEAPESWARWPDAPEHEPPIRRFVLPRFPYSIAYQAYAEIAVVLAIVHGSREPRYWIDRGR